MCEHLYKTEKIDSRYFKNIYLFTYLKFRFIETEEKREIFYPLADLPNCNTGLIQAQTRNQKLQLGLPYGKQGP